MFLCWGNPIVDWAKRGVRALEELVKAKNHLPCNPTRLVHSCRSVCFDFRFPCCWVILDGIACPENIPRT